MSLFRKRMAALVSSPAFGRTVTGLILLNALTLGLVTGVEAQTPMHRLLGIVDNVIVCLFAIEIGLRLYVHRSDFFRSGWNVFDFVIVGISLVPASGPFSILRTLRVLRLLRLISVVPRMRHVIEAMLDAIPGMGAVAAVMLILFYVSAVMTTQVFGAAGGLMADYYGSIPQSMWTLFRMMTLDGWFDVARDTMEIFPYAWIFFVIFIVIMTFAVLNLFIGIIMDAMNTLHDEAGDTRAHKDHSEEMKLLRKVERDIRKLHERLDEKPKR